MGITGGQTYVESVYNILTAAGVKLAGVWVQDWQGQQRFEEGVRPTYNP